MYLHVEWFITLVTEDLVVLCASQRHQFSMMLSCNKILIFPTFYTHYHTITNDLTQSKNFNTIILVCQSLSK